MKFLEKFDFCSIRHVFPLLIFGILIGLTVNLLCYKTEYNQMVQNTKEMETNIADLEWDYVQSVLTEDYLAAGEQSKTIAKNIDRDLHSQYPDVSVLRYQMDFHNSVDSPSYIQIFKDNIRGYYMFGIHNDNNDPFIASRKEIVMDLSMNCMPEELPRPWDRETTAHYNKSLAKEAVNMILKKDSSIIYWEYLSSDDPNHYKISKPSMKELRHLFEKEGLEGLKGIEFLAPAYITERGDIFGVDDIDDNGMLADNHKIIVVQEFNLYDQIMSRHQAEFMKYEIYRESVQKDMRHTMVTRTFSVILSTLIIIFVVFILMLLNNRMFHDRSFFDTVEKEGDESQK